MAWLIVCCDGTWNTPEMASVTNVRRLHNLLDGLDTQGGPQKTFYASGVGTTGSVADRVRAGTFGSDLDEKILEAYAWLVTSYESGDSIALFGFSRGAYTVRSLSGMISRCGLIDPSGLDPEALDTLIHRAYEEGYRRRSSEWPSGVAFRYFPRPADNAIPVRFIGVWDSVGALGIPRTFGWLPGQSVARYTFHDLDLAPGIPAARHALALDEMRGPFSPTLWNWAPGRDIAQVWFAGSHMDVGGGHPDRGLADITLGWMIDEVRRLTTIGVTVPTGQIAPDPLAVVHDDNRNQFGPGVSLLLDAPLDRLGQLFWDSRPRAIPPIELGRPVPTVHRSVYTRRRGRPITSGRYRPTRVLAVGRSATVDVPARAPWTDTGLYLEPGEYEFTADGRWKDEGDWVGPDGTPSPGRNPLTILGGAIAQVVRAATWVRTCRDHLEWIFPGERRQPGLSRMRLVGVVANDAGTRSDPDIAVHQTLDLGDPCGECVTEGGYLFAYANDAWSSYEDNAGAVRLTVTRL